MPSTDIPATPEPEPSTEAEPSGEATHTAAQAQAIESAMQAAEDAVARAVQQMGDAQDN